MQWLDFNDQASEPSAPADGLLRTYSAKLSGRMLLNQLGPSGLRTVLQPALFENNLWLVSPNQTTSLSAIGGAVTSVGTIGHPASTAPYGWMSSFATAATANVTAGTGGRDTIWTRGNGSGAAGFFYAARLGFPDASYDSGGPGVGTRLFCGLTNQVMSASVASDNPSGHYCGFFRRHSELGAQDGNWQFASKNNTLLQLQDTGLEFLPQRAIDFRVFAPPHTTEVFWSIADLTTGQIAEGSQTLKLPAGTIYMRAGFQLQTINAVARNIRMQRLYCESDR
ncbi:hypothetical protein FB106_11483 [Synechococcus sp. Ace-Pa]|nr:hypothetical protein FB106_11483 [Synechococcus sp. Ace-Pa]